MRRTAALVTALLLIAGCGAEHTPAKHTTAGHTTAASPPRTTASPTPSPALSASDGTNVAACRHDQCQILVSGAATIPLDGSDGLNQVSITVHADKVSIGVDSDPVLTVAAGCVATFSSESGMNVCGPDAGPIGAGLSVQVRAIANDKTVVELSYT